MSQFLPPKKLSRQLQGCQSLGVPLLLDSVLHQLVHAALVDDQRGMKLPPSHQLFQPLKEPRQVIPGGLQQ